MADVVPANVSSYGHFGFSELWGGGRWAGLTAGWRGAAAAAAVTPEGAAALHKEGGKGKQMLNIRSFSFFAPWFSQRKEVKCSYLATLLDLRHKLEKCVGLFCCFDRFAFSLFASGTIFVVAR